MFSSSKNRILYAKERQGEREMIIFLADREGGGRGGKEGPNYVNYLILPSVQALKLLTWILGWHKFCNL